MATIAQVAKSMQRVLNEDAEQAGYVTEFVKRQSKLTAPLFVQTLVFGFMSNPEATLEELTQTAAALGVKISPQGLDDRFTQEAADCLKRVLEKAVEQVIKADPVAVEILKRFTSAQLLDATTISLPKELEQIWAGSRASAVKLQVSLDLLSGKLKGPFLQDALKHDNNSAIAQAVLAAGALRIADLGYFDLDVLREFCEQFAYWLSRYKMGTIIFSESGEQLDLVKLLKKQTSGELDIAILLTQTHQLPCRLLAQRVPQKVANEKRRRLHKKANSQGRQPSKEQLYLANWTIYVTSVATHLLNVEEAMVLGRTRWQIELLFKLWKSHGRIDESRSKKPYHILCEVYAKLIVMLIQHWVLLVSCWSYPDRSLFKAVKTIQKNGFQLAVVFTSLSQLCAALAVIERCLAAGCRINKRRTKPHTYQLLLDLDKDACANDVPTANKKLAA